MTARVLLAFVIPFVAGCGSSGSSASKDGGTAPVRTLTTRALLPSVTNDLLLDPFITADQSWGHFRAVVPKANPADTNGGCPLLARELMSASPIGVSAPAELVNPSVLPASTGCTSILAPFVGSTEPVHAQIWVSLSDASGNAVPFPTGSDGERTLDRYLTVALLPNSLPTAASLPAYPLEPSGPPIVLAGRQWGQLALSATAPIPQGGWFAITLNKPDGGLYLAGPQVVPTGGSVGPVRSRPVTDVEEGAVRQYSKLPYEHPIRRRTRPRE
jgi:hypothetical protein